MLNRFYYLQEELPGEAPVNTPGITIAHLVDGRTERLAALLKHQYSEYGNYPFCLAVSDDLDSVVKDLLLLFFHPSYEIAEKGRPVFLLGTVEAEMRQQIEEIFQGQRLETEVIHDVITLHPNGDDPAADYYRYCLTCYRPQDIFLLSGGQLDWWRRRLEQAAHRLAADHACFYRLAMERLETGRVAADRGRENIRLAEEVQIMQQLLEVNSKHDEVDYILRFYRNEYEILPLWYKRFGHVIKVIQGRRNLRSLFDKSVKKYKD